MNIFTYGSLMYRPVWERVVSGAYQAVNGTIRGYARRRIMNEVHPALVHARSGSAVRGVVYLHVSAPDLVALDHFEDEGEAYQRIQVPVELDGGRVLNAWTYLYSRPTCVEDSVWEPEGFEGDDLRRFLETYCRDRAGQAADPESPRTSGT